MNGTERDLAVALLAVAMGTQNAVARHLAVPDLATTVLTMTLTGIASDLRRGEHGIVLMRRVLAVLAMFAGAVLGAELIVHANPTSAVTVGTGLLALVTVAAWRSIDRPSTSGNPSGRAARTMAASATVEKPPA